MIYVHIYLYGRVSCARVNIIYKGLTNEQIQKDLVFYKDLGFTQFSCFACSLCDEYVKLFGDPDFSAIAE